MTSSGRSRERGVTYIELVATAAILAILAMAVIPTAKAGRRRVKEMELRRTLREIHGCIDEFKYRTQAALGQVPPPGDGIVLATKDPPYPEKLEDLVKGVDMGQGRIGKWKCLRALPVDPISSSPDWQLYCTDDRESDTSCSGNSGIWKVTSKSDALSSDGKTRYNDPKHW